MLHINIVAELMGVTVRTLRYYDKVGLIHPASKTEGGHRLYAVEELKRLQQVQFLKKGGFSLKEIKNILDSPKWDWGLSLKNQLASVLEEKKKLETMETVLQELINSISLEGNNEERAIQNLLELSTQHQEIRQRFRASLFTESESELFDKLPNLANNSAETQEWIFLVNQLKQYMHEGVHSQNVQEIIKRMDEKQQKAFTGEEEFINKLWDIRMSPQKSKEMGMYPIDQTILEFMNDAYEAYLTHHQQKGEK
jgi:DNA-binding transcriptional MerR regulator